MTTHALHDAQRDAGHDAEHDGTWATLAEAASILGCSVDTVRRRIRRGELHAVQDAGRHGPTWRVLLSATPSVVLTVGSTPSTTPSVGVGTPGSTPSVDAETPALLEALRMLDALRQENRDLAGQVGYFQARAQILDERVRMLEAPKTEPAPAPGKFRRRNFRLLSLALAVAGALAVAAGTAPAWVR